MKSKVFAGFALALSLLAPAFSATAKYEVGALLFDQPEKFAAALDRALATMVESPGK